MTFPEPPSVLPFLMTYGEWRHVPEWMWLAHDRAMASWRRERRAYFQQKSAEAEKAASCLERLGTVEP
jgi:hypothetical protein